MESFILQQQGLIGPGTASGTMKFKIAPRVTITRNPTLTRAALIYASSQVNVIDDVRYSSAAVHHIWQWPWRICCRHIIYPPHFDGTTCDYQSLYQMVCCKVNQTRWCIPYTGRGKKPISLILVLQIAQELIRFLAVAGPGDNAECFRSACDWSWAWQNKGNRHTQRLWFIPEGDLSRRNSWLRWSLIHSSTNMRPKFSSLQPWHSQNYR
jgi:hypothetical protein